MATSILLKFLTLKWNISRTIWRIEVSDSSLFCIFHALSFELNLFSDRRFPLTMHIKTYALSVTCSTSPLFNLDVFIFAEVIQKQGDWQAWWMESSYLNLGVTSEILNRLIQVMSAVTTYNVLYTFAFLRNSIQLGSRSEWIPNGITISLFVDHFNKTILHVLSTETCQWTVILVELKVTWSCKLRPKKSESLSPSVQGPKSYS